jgi:aspartate-semialdehyde dehydrogenase
MPVVQAKKVAVLGAGGGIGQPLSLLLKMNKMVTELALYDIANVAGVAADLSHCNTPVKVRAAAAATRMHAAAAAAGRGCGQHARSSKQHGFGSPLQLLRRRRGPATAAAGARAVGPRIAGGG